MCGIFGIVNDKTNFAAQTVLTGLKKLEYRGYDSWGIALKSSEDQSLKVEKHIGKIGEAHTYLPPGTLALGHTRWATHGGVTDINAHPHLDCTKKLAVIHNGIVENYQELKSDLIFKKHHFISETDTEVIAHLVEELIKSMSIEQAVMQTFNMLVGSNAIGVLDVKTNTIIACRNGSPLVVGIGKDQYFLGSDVTPFLDKTQTVHFLLDGEAVVLAQNGVKLYDLSTLKEKKLDTQILDWKMEDAEKAGYPHFMLKEILEQLKTIPKTATINEKEIEEVASRISSSERLAFIACGTASYCGIAASYFFARQGKESKAYGAYEFLPYVQFYGKKSVVIAVSQSGETADTLIAAKAAKKNGAYLVAVVNARGSTLERLADLTLPVGAGPEIAVVSTKAFTSQLATLYLLAHAVTKTTQTAQKEIKKMGETLTQWLNEKKRNQVLLLAKSLMTHEDIYVIGKHLNYPATLEFALKIKEASYIHSEAFAAGELKHGVISLIQKGTPCIALLSNDDVKHEVLSSVAELKARGGHIIGISSFSAKEFDEIIETPDLGDLTIFANVMVGQLLGYYLGIGRGADPDKPRNLAKSVTVK